MQKDNPYLDLSAVDESKEYYNAPSFHSLTEESSDEDTIVNIQFEDGFEKENDMRTTVEPDVQGSLSSKKTKKTKTFRQQYALCLTLRKHHTSV